MAAAKLGFEIYALTTIPERADVRADDSSIDRRHRAVRVDKAKQILPAQQEVAGLDRGGPRLVRERVRCLRV